MTFIFSRGDDITKYQILFTLSHTLVHYFVALFRYTISLHL